MTDIDRLLAELPNYRQAIEEARFTQIGKWVIEAKAALTAQRQRIMTLEKALREIVTTDDDDRPLHDNYDMIAIAQGALITPSSNNKGENDAA